MCVLRRWLPPLHITQHLTEVGVELISDAEKNPENAWDAKGNTSVTGKLFVFGSMLLVYTPGKQNQKKLAPVVINNLCFHGDVDPDRVY